MAATGAVVERYAYSAYGKPIFLDASANLLDPQASTIGNPYLFTGRRLDGETGLYYYRARMYDAELGRFVSRDPIGYEDGLGLYLYATDNPVGYADASGTKPQGSNNMPPDKPPGVWQFGNIQTCYHKCVHDHKTNFACTECVERGYEKEGCT